jgi:Lipocalin-like domain
MRNRSVLGLLFAISAVVWESTPQGNAHTQPQAETSGGAGQLVGTWRLISRVVTLEDGTAVQDPGLGKTPSGYLIYDSRGHMTAQLMRPDRPMAIDCGTSAPAPSENSQSVNGYDAYFGTYTIDETSHTVTHHLEGALAAADVGKNLVREFQLSSNKLTIVVRTNSPKEKQIRTLIWERVH